MGEATLKAKKNDSDATIARRLEATLRTTREDESNLKRIIKMRWLQRRVQKQTGTK